MLINRNGVRLMAEYVNKADMWEAYGKAKDNIDIAEQFERLPAIDIVRCKDCKYCKIEDWDRDNFRVCARDQHIRSSSWFCAAGERDENND